LGIIPLWLVTTIIHRDILRLLPECFTRTSILAIEPLRRETAGFACRANAEWNSTET
jgi:hypothetical protein